MSACSCGVQEPSVVDGGFAAIDTPEYPAPPADLVLRDGATSLFGLSDEPEVEMVLNGLPAGATLTGHLCSSGGKRQHHFRADTDAPIQVLAECGWNLPAVAASATGRNDALLCFNQLTGAEPTTGAMPHPSTGLSLVCRYLSDGQLGGELVVAGEQPSWLMNARWDAEADGYRVKFFENPSGWLFNRREPGDAIKERVFRGGSFGDASTVSP
jgi:hypothetical protein